MATVLVVVAQTRRLQIQRLVRLYELGGELARVLAADVMTLAEYVLAHAA